MATSAQIKAIHTIKSKINMNDDEYRSNLKVYGVESSSDPRFVPEMAGDFIQKLSLAAKQILTNNTPDKAGTPSPALSYKKYDGKGKRGFNRHITPARAERINILEQILEWDSKRLQGFIFKQTGLSKGVEMLTSSEGGKVITGLTRIYTAGNRDLYLKINRLPNNELRKLVRSKKQEVRS